MLVILANGDFPTHPEPLRLLREAGAVICCDGAAAVFLEKTGRPPDAVAGDLDSLPPAARQACAGRIHHDPDQETNDLTKAFRFARRLDPAAEIAILGATGKREDHTLGNLSLLADYAREARVALMTDTGAFRALAAAGSLPSTPGQAVSIFSFDPTQPITSEGLRYPLRALTLPRWWRATLNEATGFSFSLSFPATSPLLVYQKYP